MLDGQVYQGSVREQGVVDAAQTCYFAIADGVAIGTRPRIASRCLLEILHKYLAVSTATESLSPLLQRVQQDYGALSGNPRFYGMVATLVGVRLLENAVTIFNVGDSRAYLLVDGQAQLLSRDHTLLNDLIDDGEMVAGQLLIRPVSCTASLASSLQIPNVTTLGSILPRINCSLGNAFCCVATD